MKIVAKCLSLKRLSFEIKDNLCNPIPLIGFCLFRTMRAFNVFPLVVSFLNRVNLLTIDPFGTN